jgi:hypothetical protein
VHSRDITGQGVVAMRREDSDKEFWAVHYGPLAGWALAITSGPELSHELACAAFVEVLSLRRRPARWRLYADVLERAEAAARDGGSRHGGWLWREVQLYPADLRRCGLLEAAGLPPAEVARVLHLRPRRRVQALLRRCAEQAPAWRRAPTPLVPFRPR